MIDAETIIDERYRVISRLGSGGMADVYLAHDQLLGREVAVKILHHHFAEDQEFVERFRREASSAAALSHPNIVGIFDRGEWNGTYYIAMEYVAGRSLKALVRETGPLDPALAIDTVIQILRAARFAHARGVIHRDLKPHNVILDEEGRARVTDFGIARAGASDMTLTGSIMGTAQYLSPEQAQGFSVSAASDLYSVGVILYELLTGVVPFVGETAVAIAFKQVSAVPRPPSELNPALPHSLDAVVLRALAKDPGQRYADDDELIRALQDELERLPGADGALSQRPIAPPPALEPPTGLLLAAPAVYVDEYGAPLEDEPRAERRRTALWWALGALVLAAAAVAVTLLLSSPSTVPVPRVTGQSEQAAGVTLRRAGLDPVPSLLASTTVPAGLVISQSPVAGTKVEKSSGVGVVVSSGPEPVHVPDLIGQSLSAAEATLTNAGLGVGTVSSHATGSQAPNTVLRQSPTTGTSVKPASTVNLVIAQAPREAAVPNVVGQSQTLAAVALGQAGFKPRTVPRATTEASQAGTVLQQSPAAGEQAPKGSTVTITVGMQATPTTTPTTTTPTSTAPAPGGGG